MDSRAFDDSSMDSTNDEIVEGIFEEVRPSAESAQLETRLVIAPQTSLAQAGNRIGCAYCFRTSNPNDPNEMLRDSVLVNEVVYHRKCWNSLLQPTGQAIDFVPPVPEPLRVVTLVGAPLYTGPINSMNDTPLGISESLLVLNSSIQSNFIVRNNSTNLVQLDRRNMPLWAFVRYTSSGHSDGHLLTLQPSQEAVIEVYPHFVRPDLVDEPIVLSETQSLMLESRALPVIPIATLIGVYTLFLWHLSTVFNLGVQYYFVTRNFLPYGGLLAMPIITCFLLLSVLMILAPGQVLWGIYSVLHRINQTAAERLFGQFEAMTLWTLESGTVEQAQTRLHSPLSLILIGITAAGTIVVWLALLLISSAFVGISGLIFLAEAGALLFVIYRVGREYGFDLLMAVQSVVRLSSRAVATIGANRS